ncbi:MAG TPA: hypothetical protein O0W88_03155 [Methanocorpusculum sp.]|nr:hypothetical protein [Methanocorpusculum sp.]
METLIIVLFVWETEVLWERNKINGILAPVKPAEIIPRRHLNARMKQTMRTKILKQFLKGRFFEKFPNKTHKHSMLT